MSARSDNAAQLRRAGLSDYRIRQLQSIARGLLRASERWCNEEMTPEQEKRLERRERWLEEDAAEIAKKLGWVVYFQGDPRGWPLYLGPVDLLRGNSIESNYDKLHGVSPH